MNSFSNDFQEPFMASLKTPESHVPDSRVGTLIGFRYALDGVLGEGGMAKVYRAKDTYTGDTCAIKILNAMFARDELIRERFRREAKNAQKLAHPNVIQVMSEGETADHCLFMAIELLQGEPLDRILARGPLPLMRAMPIMIQVSRAVARAHDYQIVHRDLKPENVFIVHREDGSECIKILDFGIAHSVQDVRLTSAGEVYGTPQYMAPERILSSEAGNPQDLYALGVLFFEILSAQLPFDADDLPSFLLKHLNEVPKTLANRNVTVPHELETLIQCLLAKEPMQRPVDAHQVHRELVHIAEHYAIAQPTSIEEEIHTYQPKPLNRLFFTLQDERSWLLRYEFWQQHFEQCKPYMREASMATLLEFFHSTLQTMKNSWNEYRLASAKLDDFETNACSQRYPMGLTIDAFGDEISILRCEVRKAREQAKAQSQAVQLACEIMHKVHREIVHWEGRSGLQKPCLELAVCYRKCADVIEEWAQASASEKEALHEAQKKENEIEEKNKQMQNFIHDFEQHYEIERASLENHVLEQHAKLVQAEQNLYDLALILKQNTPVFSNIFSDLDVFSTSFSVP